MAENGLVDPHLGKRIIAATRLARNELKIERAVKAALAVHKAKVKAAMSTQHLTAAAPPDPFDLSTWDQTVDELVQPVVVSVLAGIVSRTVGGFRLSADTRQKVLARIDPSHIAQGFMGKLRQLGPQVADRLRSELAIGVGKLETSGQLSARINNSFHTGLGIANRIIRTDTHAVSEAAALASAIGAQGDSTTLTKSWIAVHDSHTRLNHLDAEEYNQDIPLEALFVVGESECDYPGNTGDPAEDCNCRCTTEFQTVDAGLQDSP